MQKGYFGKFGGQFVPETLMKALFELESRYKKFSKDPNQQKLFQQQLRDFVGRPTALYFAENLTKFCGGAKIYLKREDLA
ncbi:MAG: tryptophan synthase subunit beta, partial [Patescibacteria group bacterium]